MVARTDFHADDRHGSENQSGSVKKIVKIFFATNSSSRPRSPQVFLPISVRRSGCPKCRSCLAVRDPSVFTAAPAGQAPSSMALGRMAKHVGCARWRGARAWTRVWATGSSRSGRAWPTDRSPPRLDRETRPGGRQRQESRKGPRSRRFSGAPWWSRGGRTSLMSSYRTTADVRFTIAILCPGLCHVYN